MTIEFITALCDTKFVKYRIILTLALTFGIIPSLLLHRFIYGITHESAIYLEVITTKRNQSTGL